MSVELCSICTKPMGVYCKGLKAHPSCAKKINKPKIDHLAMAVPGAAGFKFPSRRMPH